MALFLLAIYLPIWLLSSFHVHAYPLKHADSVEEHHSSEVDEDGCQLCLFQQVAYEETPQMAVMVNRPEIKVKAVLTDESSFGVFKQNFLSRAPPILL